ncbi:MAG: hypothetical protein H6642_17640 [Caldilineaceae bacterium]|nr:hypothetical protein [Caldilineaceae bacterium]
MDTSLWWKRTVIGGAAALTLGAGLAVASASVFAQNTDATATPTAPLSGFMQRGGMDFHHGFGDWRGGNRDEALAEQLGISVEELDAAQAAIREQALADAVAAGEISQEQVDLMTAAQALRDYIDEDAILAGALGVTTDEVATARQDGTLRDLMADMDRTELQTAMQTAVNEALAQAVADGVITQAQADLLTETGSRFSNFGFNGRGFGNWDFDGQGFDRPDFDGDGFGNRGERGHDHGFNGMPGDSSNVAPDGDLGFDFVPDANATPGADTEAQQGQGL